MDAIGLTATQRALVQNYRFMSARIPGTRQVRRSINHLVFSSRIVYGLPVFITITPSERHSILMIRLSRYRLHDPAIRVANPEFARWAGRNSPSLQSRESTEEQEERDICFDVPSYELRKLMISRDSVCSVDAFDINVRMIAAQLNGIRMCPECPHCVLSEQPCMDRYGSNATPMGGGAGRADALIGAVEGQKKEGVLHLHFFLYPQMAHQHHNLKEIADQFRARIMSVESMKAFINHTRCATYPDPAAFQAARANIEQSWPAFAADTTLCRPPPYVWESLRHGEMSACPPTRPSNLLWLESAACDAASRPDG